MADSDGILTSLILVIDDDEDFRETMASVLGAEGYGVEGAATFEQAIVALEQRSFDLLISDLLVGSSQDQPFERIETLVGAAHSAPILLSTGFAEARDYPLGELGISQLLLKPYTLDELLAAVHTHLGPDA